MLKMALQQLVCGLTVMTLLLCTGCQASNPACGRYPNMTRIVGGQSAIPGSWPWQVVLHIKGEFSCGGSLITDEWVLTAAHCLTPDDLNSTTVHLALHNRSDTAAQLVKELDQIHCHEEYDSETYFNDICLLKLSSPVLFTPLIQPVCLASGDSVFNDGTLSWVTGFGDNGFGDSPEVLQEVMVPIVGNNRCSCYYQDSNEIIDSMMCAGFEFGGKDSCQGDSGGPLVTMSASSWVQSGVVSFGVGCAQPEKPGVYTRVSAYQEWIENIVTGMRPAFTDYMSQGHNPDEGFECSSFTTTPPPTTTVDDDDDDDDDSLFGSGETLSHFTHFLSLTAVTVLLHVFVGSERV